MKKYNIETPKNPEVTDDERLANVLSILRDDAGTNDAAFARVQRALAIAKGSTTPHAPEVTDEDVDRALVRWFATPNGKFATAGQRQLMRLVLEDFAARRVGRQPIGRAAEGDAEDLTLDDLVYRTLKKNEPHLEMPVRDLRLMAERIVTALRRSRE
jgi:hypothetical protein